MENKSDKNKKQPNGKAGKQEKLAAALRRNLLRRKQATNKQK